jgi:hypothetical protein
LALTAFFIGQYCSGISKPRIGTRSQPTSFETIEHLLDFILSFSRKIRIVETNQLLKSPSVLHNFAAKAGWSEQDTETKKHQAQQKGNERCSVAAKIGISRV